MQLNLSQAQKRKAKNGVTFQITPDQIGSGDFYNLHPSNTKKLMTASRLGKGVRLMLSDAEISNGNSQMEGAGIGKRFKRAVRKTANKAGKFAKKNITEKNVAKYALKGYNRLNDELEKQGMPSVHSAILNEGLGYVPFVPQSVKDVGSAYAEKAIDRKLRQETERIGAGFRKTMNRGLKKAGIKKDAYKLASKVNKSNVNRALGKANQIARDMGYDNDVQTMVAKKLAPRNKDLQNVMKNEFNDYMMEGAGFRKTMNRGLKKAGIKKDAYKLASKVNKSNVNKALGKANQIARDMGYDNDVQTMVAKKLAPKSAALQNVMKNEFNDMMEGGSTNPYLPTGLIGGKMTGGRMISVRKYNVYDDRNNMIRPRQSGFAARSRNRSLESTTKVGGSFRTSGGSFKN